MTHLHLANNNITKIKGRAPWPVMNSIIYLDLNNNNLGDSLDGGKVHKLYSIFYAFWILGWLQGILSFRFTRLRKLEHI